MNDYGPVMTTPRNGMGGGYLTPYVATKTVDRSVPNPEGIRRNANTFKGTANAPVAPEGKTNPSGANRSAQVTSQV